MDPKRLVRVSKFLSLHLRHQPADLGLTLEPGGWVPVADLIAGAARAGFRITPDELAEVVRSSDKQRFAFDPTGAKIRANQGHSAEVDLQLELAEPPAVLYHGTAEPVLAAILGEGLKKMARHHVHLSPDTDTATKVGSRHGKLVILAVNAAAMRAAGHAFFRSANGVWLVDAVPPEYLRIISPREPAMHPPIQHPAEPASNAARAAVAGVEPRSLRTFTPSQAVLAKSAGVYHWTPEGRRLFDFTSGVLVSNLGHNPVRWTRRFFDYMGWPAGGKGIDADRSGPFDAGADYFPALAMTAYNAVTTIEAEASRRLVAALRRETGGGRMEQVMWAASGSEAIQKALWAAAARDRTRPMIVATRYGFHGKKGLANAVTGSEADAERDPRVRFVTFPTAECRDVALRGGPFDPAPYQKELDALLHQFGRRIGTLITEPYLGGGGSYHPPKAYLQLLERWCRANDVVFILDEVQANFGRTGSLFAFTTYGVEPDLVVLGKGLGNGVPVAAAVGRADIFSALDYGEGSDTWSANPLNCAAVLATLDEFEARDVIGAMKEPSAVIERGLVALKEYPFVAAVRGELGGMVWGVEFADHAGKTAAEWANAFVLAGYQGDGAGGDGVHLLGPLSKKVVRVSPPLTITTAEATAAMAVLARAAARLAR